MIPVNQQATPFQNQPISSTGDLGIILQMIAAGADTDGILAVLSSWAEQELEQVSCSILLGGSTGELTRLGITPGLAERVVRSVGPTPLSLSQVITDSELTCDPKWAGIREVSQHQGLPRYWSFPIIAPDNTVSGIVLLGFQRIDPPTEAEAKIAQMAASLAGIALQRTSRDQSRTRRLQTVIEHMNDGVVAVNTHETITVLNPAAIRLLGLPGFPVGRRLAESGIPRPLIDTLLQTAEGECDERRLTLAVGATHVEAVVSPLSTALGRRHGAVAVLHDITLQRAYRILQEAFIANVSHELRAPLTTISAVLEALSDGLVPEADRGRYFRATLSEVQRLRKLSTQVLELSRLDAGMLTPPVNAIHLGDLLSNLEALWRERCRNAGVTLRVDHPEIAVQAAYEPLEQILTNLLDNAVHFTPEGGEIVISAVPEGDMVRINVRDTGVGIEHEHLPYVWERFYMADQARTRSKRRGSGLGLSIVKLAVQRLGGQIFAESSAGEGSVFGFTLPAAF